MLYGACLWWRSAWLNYTRCLLSLWLIVFVEEINPCKTSVLFKDHMQIVQTQTRRRRTSVRSGFCSIKIEIKMQKYHQKVKKEDKDQESIQSTITPDTGHFQP